jgi:small-conductance mechanosensitive channel
MFIENILNFFLENNSSRDYIISAGIFLGLFLILKFFNSYFVYILKKITKKLKTTWKNLVIDFLEAIKWPFYAYLAFYIATAYLVLSEILSKILFYILIVFITFYISKGVISISNHFFERYREKKKRKNEKTSESMINVMKFIVKILIWTFALLMILYNFGIQITPLIAGLGVGGIAIGLALQNILSDLFSAFAIYFDKPFEEGDFIIVGNDMGVVKYIGIKSTRIQALGGQELVVSNRELTSIRINNYKKMNTRRVLFNFGVEYGTSNNKLKKIKKILEEIIKKEEHANLDRVHFKEFGNSSLNFEVVYYVDSKDYNVYMDTQEKINLKIKESLEKEKISFAFPSTSVYMKD